MIQYASGAATSALVPEPVEGPLPLHCLRQLKGLPSLTQKKPPVQDRRLYIFNRYRLCLGVSGKQKKMPESIFSCERSLTESNRSIMVLQTIPLTTWVRLHVSLIYQLLKIVSSLQVGQTHYNIFPAKNGFQS